MLGAYQPLLSGAADFLARARVHTQPSGNRRTILNFWHVNAACRKHSCRYEDLPTLLRPGDRILSLDLSAAFWHCTDTERPFDTQIARLWDSPVSQQAQGITPRSPRQTT